MDTRPDWRTLAACRGTDPELFFPEGVKGPALQAAARAKWICAACPVQAQCLDWAATHGAAFGIWGGRTEQERHAHRITSLPSYGRLGS
jgi:WhiB family redox-sensing transcriptional regulator